VVKAIGYGAIGCIVPGSTAVVGAFEGLSGALPSPWYFLFAVSLATVFWITGRVFHHFYFRL
jgi:hypothetical protein